MSYYKKPHELLVLDSASKRDGIWRSVLRKFKKYASFRLGFRNNNYEVCVCGTGFDWRCTAHENKTDCPAHQHKNRFPWGTAILVFLFFALLIFDMLYGGFNPLLFPGDGG